MQIAAHRNRLLLLLAAQAALGCNLISSARGNSSSSSGNTGSSAASTAQFADKDEGSLGPLQDANEGKVVFTHAALDRKDNDASSLVMETTLDKPLYVRAYSPRTPARVLHENGQSCVAPQLKFFAKLDGAKSGVWLYTMPLGENTKAVMRAKSITDLAGDNLASIVPTKKFEMDEPVIGSISAFVQLAAEMKPGKNSVAVEMSVGCDAQLGKNGREFTPVSTGSIVFNVKQGDLAKFARKVGPVAHEGMSDEATARLKAAFSKQLVAGAKLLSFAADGTAVEPMVRKKTDVRIVMRNADKTCSYRSGTWIEEHTDKGFGPGALEAVAPSRLVPCP